MYLFNFFKKNLCFGPFYGDNWSFFFFLSRIKKTYLELNKSNKKIGKVLFLIIGQNKDLFVFLKEELGIIISTHTKQKVEKVFFRLD